MTPDEFQAEMDELGTWDEETRTFSFREEQVIGTMTVRKISIPPEALTELPDASVYEVIHALLHPVAVHESAPGGGYGYMETDLGPASFEEDGDGEIEQESQAQSDA